MMTESGPHLVVIGAPGAGKTRVGKRVARLLKVKFIDTDRRIVAAHGPIATIFAERGETWFRQVERVEVAKALSEVGVVSLGGGAILDPATQEQLAHHRIAMLTVSAEAVEKRIADAKRPLLKDGIDAWLSIVESRREIYERLASRSWDTSDLPIDQIAAEIAEWVLEDSASKELP